MHLSKKLTLTGLIIMSLGLTACGGGGATMQASTTTMGQELMDLEKSYKQGIISKREYENAKETILERYE